MNFLWIYFCLWALESIKGCSIYWALLSNFLNRLCFGGCPAGYMPTWVFKAVGKILDRPFNSLISYKNRVSSKWTHCSARWRRVCCAFYIGNSSFKEYWTWQSFSISRRHFSSHCPECLQWQNQVLKMWHGLNMVLFKYGYMLVIYYPPPISFFMHKLIRI